MMTYLQKNSSYEINIIHIEEIVSVFYTLGLEKINWGEIINGIKPKPIPNIIICIIKRRICNGVTPRGG